MTAVGPPRAFAQPSTARDCDLTLPTGSVQGVRCTVRMPAEESATEFANTVSYTASPAEGDPLTGTESATVALLPGQAPEELEPGADPADPSPPEDGSDGGADENRREKNDDLAYTGATILMPFAVGAALLLVGTAAVVVTRRRRARA